MHTDRAGHAYQTQHPLRVQVSEMQHNAGAHAVPYDIGLLNAHLRKHLCHQFRLCRM